MSPAIFRRNTSWLPAIFVLTVVLLAGSRLIVLSAQQRAADSRETTRAEAARAARGIESQLQALSDRAVLQAGRAVSTANGALPLTAVRPDHDAFWIAADGTATLSAESSATVVNGILAEWSAAARPHDAAPLILGPTRQGSQWVVAALAPLPAQPTGDGTRAAVSTDDGTHAAGWSVAYKDLDQIVSTVQLSRIVNAGYDYALTQVEPRSERSRTFVSSAPAMPEAEAIPIHLPAGFSPAISGSYLQFAMRPRAGWYPAGELAVQIGILAVMAWLLAFGIHDMNHTLTRLQSIVGIYRRRVHAMAKRLSVETHQRQDLQKSIDHARYHDGFTGLPNRRYFVDQLDRALREVSTRRRPLIAIVLIDIARFKLINDTLGHTAGDELMVQAARRFAKATTASECVLARWGGDQFAALILDVTSEEAALAFAVLLHEALRPPFELRRHRLRVSASMGLTCVDSGPQRAEDVLREADIALSVAKRHDTKKTVLYVPAMGGQAASLVSLEADLHLALEKNELRLLFQPIVDLRTQRMVGAEALLRWRHPVEGALLPEKFITIAEEAGLMPAITRRIILRVCKLAAEWRQNLQPGHAFYLSINLSASVLRDPGFSEYVANVLQDTGVPPAGLKFEVTEAALISNVGAAREVLERLHQLGVQLMLDDFGTGYSSLNYLQLFPLDFVKIDRPFLTRTVADRANSGMMSAILQIAPSLGLTAIAEMVETESAVQALRELGCHFGQGYFFSEPVPAELALQYLRGEPFPNRPPPGPLPSIEQTGTHSPVVTSAPPQEDDSPTVIVPPLEDDSPTVMLPAGSISDEGFVDEA